MEDETAQFAPYAVRAVQPTYGVLKVNEHTYSMCRRTIIDGVRNTTCLNKWSIVSLPAKHCAIFSKEIATRDVKLTEKDDMLAAKDKHIAELSALLLKGIKLRDQGKDLEKQRLEAKVALDEDEKSVNEFLDKVATHVQSIKTAANPGEEKVEALAEQVQVLSMVWKQIFKDQRNARECALDGPFRGLDI